MNIVLDTNIVMSIIIKPNGKIHFLFDGLAQTHKLFISEITLIELANHHSKLLKFTKLTIRDFEVFKTELLKRLDIVSSEFLSDDILLQSYNLVSGVDENDIAFVASAIFVGGGLWTGDKLLYNSLQNTDLFENL